MPIYKLEVFDGSGERLNIGHPNLPMGIHNLEEDLLILTFDFEHWRGDPDKILEQDNYVRMVSKRLQKRIMALNFPGAQDAKFLKITEEIDSLPSKERKPLYSRKLRLGRKHDTEDKEETDVKVCEKKEEISEEDIPTEDEENTTRWVWSKQKGDG